MPKPLSGPRSDDDEDALEKPEEVPSFLTAREFEARDPAKNLADARDGADGDAEDADEGETQSDAPRPKSSPRKSK